MKRTLVALVLLVAAALMYGQLVFTDQAHSIPGVYNSSVAWGDYDGDGDLDALVAGKLLNGAAYTGLWRNDSGTFVDANAGIPGYENVAVAWGDYDNDTDLDIAISGLSANVPTTKIYTNSGGVFSPYTNANLPGLHLGSLVWVDYDNDGDLDLMFTGKNEADTPKTYIFKNHLGVFTDSGITITGVWNSSLAWGDVDKDGDLDLFITGMGTAAVAELWRNTNGTMAKVTLAAIQGLSLSSVDWGDYDNDGDLDLFMAGNRLDVYYSKVFRNDSSGGTITFTDMAFGLPGVQNAALKVGDLDNDGDMDLLLSGEQSPGSFISKIYRNNEAVFFEDPYSIPGVRAGSISFGDYDSDAKLDILLTGLDVNGIPLCKVYKNQISEVNAMPAVPTGLTMNVDPSNPDYLILSWNPSTDDDTPQAALSYILRIGINSEGQEISPPHSPVSGYRKLPMRGYATSNSYWRLKVTAVPFGISYWSVQAIDASFTGSAWATQESYYGGKVLSPNGGEILRAGTAATIYWYSLANSTNTNVYISTNNGVEWTLLNPTPVLSSLGRLAFTVPTVISTQCLVKIEDAANSALYDVSDGTFSIASTGPYIEVTSHTTPSKLQVGSQHMITWTSSGVSNLKIELSIDEGQSWTMLVPSVSAALGYKIITVPNTVAPLCYFRLSSLENANVYAWNKAPFSIVLLELLFPNLGDHVMTSPPTTNKLNVSWTVLSDGSNNITSLKVLLSIDNGDTWTQLTASTPYLTGTYSGTIPPNTISSECLVRIEDSSDATVQDVSTGPFVIADMKITSPNTAVRWLMGKTYPITWTQNGVVGLLKLQYSFAYLPTGTTWTTIAENIPANQGEYLWTVPLIASSSFSTCRIRICRQEQDSFFDISDTNFSVVLISLISPVGGEQWFSPPTRTITWEAYGLSNSKIEVSLDSGATWIVVKSSQATGTGINNYIWNTAGLNSWSPLLPGDYDNALLRISDTNTSAQDVFVVSPAPFTLKQQIYPIYPPNPYAHNVEMPHITNGHLTLIRGSSYVILWKADPSITDVSLYYQRGTGTASQIVASTPCVPSTQFNALYGLPVGEQYCAYTWNIPSGLALGTNYRIRIRRYPATTPYIEDWTDYFTIADNLPAVDFVGEPLQGYTPMDVQFTDLSPNGSAQILSWHWDFGDGSTSTLQHPLHTYQNPGSYDVSLTVDNNVDAERNLIKANYVVVVGNFAQISYLGDEPVPFYARAGESTGWAELQCKNTGTANLQISNITCTNANFSILYEQMNTPILPDSTTTIYVRYTAVNANPVQATLNIISNAHDNPTLHISLVANDVPVQVQNLVVNIIDDSAVLTWSPVTMSVLGDSLTPDVYIVEYNEVAEAAIQAYYYLSATVDTTFTHYLVARYEDRMFYRVLAVKDLSPALREYLLTRTGKAEKITWDELQLRFAASPPKVLKAMKANMDK